MTRTKKRMTMLIQVPQSQLDEFPACLVGARIEEQHEPNLYVWLFEFKAVYWDGTSGWEIWKIEGFAHYEGSKVKKALLQRAFAAGIKVLWLYRIRKPPSSQMYEFIIETNRKLKEQRNENCINGEN